MDGLWWDFVARFLTALALVTLLGSEADGLPVLRLALWGNATDLPTGAASAFHDPREQTLSLERPAWLTDERSAFVRFAADAESTLSIGGEHFWAGTGASDFRSRLTVVVPFKLMGRPGAAAFGGRFETGSLHVQNRREGTLVDLEERRTVPLAAVAFQPWRWLRVGAAAGRGTYTAQMLAAAGPVEVGLVRRRERLSFAVDAPEGPARPVTRPAIAYDIDQSRSSTLALASLRTRHVEIFASWDALNPTDAVADAAIRPLPWWTLRGHWSSTRYAFDDWARNEGELFARVDLGVRVSRWAAGTDFRFGRHHIHLRRAGTRLVTASAWEDNGAVTARKFFELEADFDLYLRHVYQAAFDGWALGWRGQFVGWSVAAGLQHLAADHARGGLVYGSTMSASLSGSDEVSPAFLNAVVATAGLEWQRGSLLVRLAAAQLVPYQMGDPRRPGASPPPGPSTPTGEGPSLWERVQEATGTFSGGRLVLLELEHGF